MCFWNCVSCFLFPSSLWEFFVGPFTCPWSWNQLQQFEVVTNRRPRLCSIVGRAPPLEWEWKRAKERLACKNRQPFQGAGKHNKRYLHFKFIRFQSSKRNIAIDLIHPIRRVVGTMSLLSNIFLPGNVVSMSPQCGQGRQILQLFLWTHSMLPQPIFWQGGNIVSKFPILPLAHGRPCFQCWANCKDFQSFVPMMKDFMPLSTSAGSLTMERSNRRNTLHKSCLHAFLLSCTETSDRSDHGVKIPETL